MLRHEVTETEPGLAHPLVPGEDASVHSDDPMHSVRPRRSRHSQPYGAAPIMDDDRYLPQVELVKE